MTSAAEEWCLETRHIGRRVLVYRSINSTNTQAAALAGDPANAGTVVLADEQTAGRGQHGRTWLSWPGTGVLLSVLLFPPPPLRRPAVLTAWVAVAVCETIRVETGLPAQIKWPNDVLIRGRKVCGILIEQGVGTVAGIGLNVNQTADQFAAAELAQAGSLALFTDRIRDSHEVARRLIGQLDESYSGLCQGDVATLEACWRQYLGLLGKLVTVECHDGTCGGLLRELTFDYVELEQADGRLLVLRPETVRHLELV